jgi:peroxiredoxin
MRIIKTITILAILLVSINGAKAEDNIAAIGSKAPEFKLSDSYDKEHSLSDFAGKFVVLEWVNFDCPFVKKHYDESEKNMQSLQAQMTSNGVVWLSICSSAPGKQGNFTKDEINKRIETLGAKMNFYLIDEDGKVGKMYAAKTTPHMYIIDKSGNLVYQGAIDDKKSTEPADIKTSKNYIVQAALELMSGKSLTVPSTVPYGCSVKY